MTTRIRYPHVRYHRNGVAGEGFHAVTFMSGITRYVATVFADQGRCAVIDLNTPLSPMRGDYFEKAIREAITAADESGESFRQEVSK